MGRFFVKLAAPAAVLCLVVASVSHGQPPEQGRGTPAGADRLPRALFIPTPHDVVAEMLRLADVQKRDVVYDLGCGDGRIVVAAAKTYGCRAVGFDVDPRRVKESRENVRRNRLGHLVKIEQQDVLKLDLRPATVVTLYLSSKFNLDLFPQFEKLKPGSRIVSHAFGMRGVKPDRVVQVKSKEDGRKHVLFLWTTPLKRRN